MAKSETERALVAKDIRRENKRELIEKLNNVELPKDPNKWKVLPDWYYIIYEENLLSPKILRYRFKSEYFARKYSKEYLKGVNHNILIGQILLDFGLDLLSSPVIHKKSQKKLPAKLLSSSHYCFAKGLDRQRKKTLRTMYRRNMRRILLKLLNNKKQ